MSSMIGVFAAHVVVTVLAVVVGFWSTSRSRVVWTALSAVGLGLMFMWPLLRVFPVMAIEWLGARTVASVELTGLAVPAGLVFAVASRRLPRPSDRRAIALLGLVAAGHFVHAGWWMVSPGVTKLPPMRVDGRGVCRQSTQYTCVAASMVTMLRAFGVEATELELAKLCRTQVGGGATDSRALWALEEKLALTTLMPVYAKLDRAGIVSAPKPCMVQLDWGYFVSHMVPVMEATEAGVVIGDPLSGPRTVSMGEFLSTWKGAAIMVKPRESGETR